MSAVVSTGIIIIGSSPTVPSSLPITDGESINFIGPEVHIPFSEEINSTLDGLLVARDPKRLIDFRQHLMNAMSLIERTYRIAIEADVGSRKTKMYYWIGKKKPGIIKTTVTAGWITARQARRLSREFRR